MSFAVKLIRSESTLAHLKSSGPCLCLFFQKKRRLSIYLKKNYSQFFERNFDRCLTEKNRRLTPSVKSAQETVQILDSVHADGIHRLLLIAYAENNVGVDINDGSHMSYAMDEYVVRSSFAHDAVHNTVSDEQSVLKRAVDSACSYPFLHKVFLH